MRKQKRILKIADKIINQLKAEGFIIQRYDSITTNSVYLKLDFGVANSIRISDHMGKKHLSYRYNVLLDVSEPYGVMHGPYLRCFYGPDHLEKLIGHIKGTKDKKIKQYGENRYKRFMKENEYSNQGSRGFWAEAKLV